MFESLPESVPQQRRHHGWKHLRVPEADEQWEFEGAQMLHEDGELFVDVTKS